MDLIKTIERYKYLGIDDVIDHEKFNLISIVHHSTKIEGSTLTEVETQVLLNEGLTPKGKPVQDTFMVTDHYAALQFVLKQAKAKRPVSTDLIQEINSLVIRNTGSVYNTMLGIVDARTGAFRKGNVTAGSTYFPNYDKVEKLTNNMVAKINEMMIPDISMDDQINLSFDAHFNLVSIHPFYDGNGRTSRLIMNYIQACYGLPLAIVHNESKAEYIQALIDTREKEDLNIFRAFMTDEYKKSLTQEIEKFQEMTKPKKGGKGFSLMF
ncbi:Fic family protein [Pedobacter nutrimenti]|uniref:Fic family protein n=1 Tax=Pedobacter nutrimenti TaxID=1241337 RepID=UPI00105BF988|nr:Fic family protein [Pedobacter nutrimenti]